MFNRLVLHSVLMLCLSLPVVAEMITELSHFEPEICIYNGN